MAYLQKSLEKIDLVPSGISKRRVDKTSTKDDYFYAGAVSFHETKLRLLVKLCTICSVLRNAGLLRLLK